MISIYYQSLGRQFEIRGAPSVMLPPEIELLSLGRALELMSDSPARLREALWRTVQGVPLNDPKGIHAYPTATRQYFGEGGIERLDGLRRSYRSGANVFAAALVAARDNDIDLFHELIKVLERKDSSKAVEHGEDGSADFSAATFLLMEKSAPDCLHGVWQDSSPQDMSGQIRGIESEVGLNIHDLVESLADVAAFETYWSQTQPSSNVTNVYPVCSVIRQDSKNLTTSATVTTIVRGEFEKLCAIIDPAYWEHSSDVIDESRYIVDPLDLEYLPATDIPAFGTDTDPLFLNELAAISWGGNPDQQGTFHNVLNIRNSVQRDTGSGPTAEVKYNLCRSIDSKVLWDRRAGGLLLNQGFIKIRPLGNDNWRVTMRKELQFSDRTPYDNPSGWLDFGELINFMAPATLTWWLECETYSLADDGGPQRAQPNPASGADQARMTND